MPFFSRKKHSDEAPSTLASTTGSGLPSSQVAQQLQLPTNSQLQSHLQPPQEKQQSQPVYPWSAHAPPFRQSPSPFLRKGHALALSKSTALAGELFLFGGRVLEPRSRSNDLYVISTRDFSTTLLQTSGDVPSPRDGHCTVLIGTTLLIWGGKTDLSLNDRNAQTKSNIDSLYLLNLVSREWTRIVINGPGPGGRYNHTMSLVGSKLFVFGGKFDNRYFNDVWALDLNSLESNPFWEPYEPVPGNEKPLPRAGHVLVTTGDRIIIFGGYGVHDFNDTWSFNISTREWTTLQCTGIFPSPRAYHAAVLVNDVMYVFGGRTIGGTILDDLTALNLSIQRWTSFIDIGPSPCGRKAHAMASDGRRVFLLGGELSPGSQVNEINPIYVIDTTLLIYPKADSNTGATHATLSTDYHTKLVALDAPSGKEIARLEDGRHIELERKLSETLVLKTERDQHITQLTDELALKSALLKQATEEKNRAGLGQHELQAKLDELLLSRDQALEQARSALQSAAEVNERSQRELAEVHAKLEARESELTAVRLRLTNAEVGCEKSKAEADTLRAGIQAAAGLINMDVDRVVRRLMERVRSVEAEMASLRGNEKSIGEMECNEGPMKND